MSEVIRINDRTVTGELCKVDPSARGVDLRVRPATPGDFAFIDALQKQESDKVGFMYEQAIRKRIEEGNILIAEAIRVNSEQSTVNSGEEGSAVHCSLGTVHSPAPPVPVGYCLGVDRYMKRGDVGIIYQMAVVPAYRRMNVAAALLQAQFEESAYGCRLYCCWCKQSLEANRFWEAMGFVPLAFRAAGRSTIEKIQRKTGDTKGAVHVFWQKPVRAADVEAARAGTFRGWWYPYETQGGAMMESRVILPLPPEVQWDEATPVVLPGAEQREAEQKLLEQKVEAVSLREKAAKKAARRGKHAKTPPGSRSDAKQKQASRTVVGYGFGAGSGFGAPAEPPEPPDAPGAEKPGESVEAAALAGREQALAEIRAEKDAAKRALKAAQRKSDPVVVAFARELRDRWQEHVAPGSALAGVLAGKCRGKYDVGRLPPGGRCTPTPPPGVIAEASDAPRAPGVQRLDAA